jgi:hypothetical protein
MAEDPFERYGFMRGPRPAPPMSNEDLAESIRLSPTKPEKSIVQKIEEANADIKKAIAEGKLYQGVQVRWAARVRDALRPLYGEKAPLVETLKSWCKELAKNQLAPNELVSRVEQIEHLLSPLQASAGSGSIVASSRKSLFPITKDVFIIHGHDEMNLLRLSRTVTMRARKTNVLGLGGTVSRVVA